MEGHTHLYPMPTEGLTHKRRDLAPAVDHAFREFSRLVFADGVMDAKTKQLIAVALAHDGGRRTRQRGRRDSTIGMTKE
jgi:alkylhydroperoxidase/carboxymuconolactone decarboxylase family protein YurZ